MIMCKFFRIIQICLLNYLYLCLVSCSNNVTSQVTIEVVDGVTIVSNSEQGLWGEAGEMYLQEILTIEPDGTNGELLFAGINDLDVDSFGKIYICDVRENKILIFSSEGKLLRNVGTRGSGPGELWAPSGIALGPGNRIYTLEKGNRRVSIFSNEGVYINSFKTDLQWAGQDLLVNPISGGIYLTSIHDDTTIFVYDDSGRLQHRFAQVPLWGKVNYQGTNVPWHAPASMTPLPVKGLLLNLAYPYEIRKYSWEGQLQIKISTECPWFLPPQLVKHEIGAEVIITRGNVIKGFSLSSGQTLIGIVDRGEEYLEDTIKLGNSIKTQFETGKKSWDHTQHWKYYYDLYDEQGRFLQRFPNPVKTQTLWYIDPEGNAYFVNKASELPGLTKYKLTFSR